MSFPPSSQLRTTVFENTRCFLNTIDGGLNPLCKFDIVAIVPRIVQIALNALEMADCLACSFALSLLCFTPLKGSVQDLRDDAWELASQLFKKIHWLAIDTLPFAGKTTHAQILESEATNKRLAEEIIELKHTIAANDQAIEKLLLNKKEGQNKPKTHSTEDSGNKSAHDVLVKRNADLMQEIEQVKQQKTNFATTIGKLEEELRELFATNCQTREQLQKSLDDSSRAQEFFSKEKDKQQAKITELENEHTRLTETHDKALKELENSLRAAILSAETRASGFQQQLSVTDQQKEQILKDYKDVQLELQATKDECLRATTKAAAHETEIVSLKEQINQLRNENNVIAVARDAAEKELAYRQKLRKSPTPPKSPTSQISRRSSRSSKKS